MTPPASVRVSEGERERRPSLYNEIVFIHALCSLGLMDLHRERVCYSCPVAYSDVSSNWRRAIIFKENTTTVPVQYTKSPCVRQKESLGWALGPWSRRRRNYRFSALHLVSSSYLTFHILIKLCSRLLYIAWHPPESECAATPVFTVK